MTNKLRSKYLDMKNAVLKIELWWKMIQEKKRYKELVKRNRSVIILQQRWRAFKCGREARNMYSKYRSCIILIQQKWRATQMMNLERRRFMKKRLSAIVIQKYWRSYRIMKEFHKKKQAAITIQRWRRRVVAGRKDRARFMAIKANVNKMQRLWRTTRQRKEFIKYRAATISIQKNWRRYKAVKEFQKKKKAAQIIQRWRRNLVIARNTRREINIFRENVIKIQSYWRMKVQLREYKRKKEAVIILQKYYRRYLAMKEYKAKKLAVLFIENWRKHILIGRRIRTQYLKLKATVIKLQRLFRIKRTIKKYKKQWDAAITIQRFWKSLRKARECKMQYEAQKAAAIVLQRHYRAKKIATSIRNDYLFKISAIITIQKWWRCIIHRRNLEILKKKQKWAIFVIETWWIYISKQRSIRKIEKHKFEQKIRAVIKIQAAWRGFKIRQTASKKMTIVRERAKEAAKAAVPSATLASRLQENIEIFMGASNIGQLSLCLSSLDVITRLSSNACISVCQLNLVSKLYDILTRANRSLPWLDVCLKDISILLTLAKFKPTITYVLKEEYIEILARLLTISVDKKEDLFLHTATLMWVLTENNEYAEAAKRCSRTKYLLSSLYTSINKKLTRASISTTKCKDILPSSKPDWGLKQKRPRTFQSVSQAITTITSRLRILNIVQTPDIQRSFNFSM